MSHDIFAAPFGFHMLVRHKVAFGILSKGEHISGGGSSSSSAQPHSTIHLHIHTQAHLDHVAPTPPPLAQSYPPLPTHHPGQAMYGGYPDDSPPPSVGDLLACRAKGEPLPRFRLILRMSHPEVCRWLRQANPLDVLRRDTVSGSFLHAAAWSDAYVDHVTYVLDKLGADINVLYGGYSALHWAFKSPLVVRVLLERGADPSVLDKEGKNVLVHFLKFGAVTGSLTTLLKDKRGRALVNTPWEGRYPLHLACASRDYYGDYYETPRGESRAAYVRYTVLQCLLEAGADPTALDPQKRTPMKRLLDVYKQRDALNYLNYRRENAVLEEGIKRWQPAFVIWMRRLVVAERATVLEADEGGRGKRAKEERPTRRLMKFVAADCPKDVFLILMDMLLYEDDHLREGLPGKAKGPVPATRAPTQAPLSPAAALQAEQLQRQGQEELHKAKVWEKNPWEAARERKAREKTAASRAAYKAASRAGAAVPNAALDTKLPAMPAAAALPGRQQRQHQQQRQEEDLTWSSDEEEEEGEEEEDSNTGQQEKEEVIDLTWSSDEEEEEDSDQQQQQEEEVIDLT